MRLDKTRKEEVSRALFSRLRREKAPQYTVEAASGSQKVGEDCCVVVHALLPY